MLNGLPITVPITPAAAAIIHTLDLAPTAGDVSGRPYLDQLSLWLENGDAAVQVITVTITPPGQPAVSIPVSVPARTVVQVFNETVMGGRLSGLGGATIAVQTAAGVATAWGWYVRTTG